MNDLNFSRAISHLLLNKQPFFASLIMRMKVRKALPQEGIEYGATNGAEIMLSQTALNTLPSKQLAGLLAHEVLHCAFLHFSRKGGRDHMGWNIATDYAINQILVDAGMELPKGALLDSAYTGMSAEDIYEKLVQQSKQRAKTKPKQKNKDGQNEPGESPAKGSGQKDQIGSDEERKEAMKGEVREATGSNGQPLTPAEKDALDRQMREFVAEAVQIAQMSGTMPANLKRLLGDVLDPKIPWGHVLQRFMTESRPADYTWARPSRRHIGRGTYLPSVTKDPHVKEIVVAIDTSGSMTEQQLTDIAGELNGIMSTLGGGKLHVVYCDCRINRVDTFTQQDTLHLEMVGGGGTDFRPVLRWIEDNCANCQCLVYFTDGEADFPDSPEYPVLWGIINSSIEPPWGEVIHIQ